MNIVEEKQESSENPLKIPSRETISISVKKRWDDSNNQDGIRPKSVVIKLMNGEEVVDAKEITSDDNWEYTFKDVFKYEEDHEKDSDYEIKYTIDEVMVSGYKKTISGFNVINTHSPKKINITGNIIWKDNNSSRPKTVVVKLMKNNEEVERKNVTKDNNWRYTFINLYKYENGKEVEYVIDEEKINNYEKKADKYNLVNTCITDKNNSKQV